ncbi:MAG TPA: CCA tRNA nucleotidyltransferase [Longimicrobiales bacterium]|nr:CCA tRNA nucleotidyltransferase [Longimicrobiales bacterium]
MRWITRKLESAGYETWAVGGAIRDALQGHPSGDWDLATRARPEEVRRIFRRTVPIGMEHGTVGVLSDDGVMYEVTTFRKDVETDGRHAVVSFADSVEEDLERRDFTMNAIAWHPLRGEIRDPFDGLGDLDRGVLRAVGVAEERFAEDYLRILRALRFAGRFGLTVEAATWAAACAGVEKLRALSAERIREELLKILGDDRRPSGALELYRRSGALGVLYPELQETVSNAPERWDGLLRMIDHLPPGRPLMRLAALLRPLSPRDAAQILMRMKISNVQADEVARRAGAPAMPGAGASDADVRRWLSQVGRQRLAALGRLELARARNGGPVAPDSVVASWRRCRQILAQKPPLDVGDLAVDGRDLIRMGLRPGPRFGTLLSELLNWVLDDPARNEAVTLLAHARALTGDGGSDV